MAFELMPLPYAQDALEPHISQETIEYHYGKHHKGYVTKLNKALEEHSLAGEPLESIIRQATGGLFNNAAQVWNHDFYWKCLSPNGGNTPSGSLASAIDQAFGSFDSFCEQFTEAAKGNFGSGWTWLVKNGDGELEIINTDDADTPVARDHMIPLLTVDVWEHAYYIDYRNARPDYLKAFWKLVDWDFVSANYVQA